MLTGWLQNHRIILIRVYLSISIKCCESSMCNKRIDFEFEFIYYSLLEINLKIQCDTNTELEFCWRIINIQSSKNFPKNTSLKICITHFFIIFRERKQFTFKNPFWPRYYASFIHWSNIRKANTYIGIYSLDSKKNMTWKLLFKLF